MSFVSLHTGLSGLRAAQTGVDVTANNVANAATPGYTRQRVELRPRPVYDSPNGLVGTGVKVDDIVRLRDTFLDNRVRSATGTFSSHDTRARTLSRLEVVFAEPDDGISAQMNEVWAALEDLALDPSNPANRTVALTQLSSLTNRVRDVASGTEALLTDARQTRGELVTEAQDLLTQIADINRTVANGAPGTVSNTLLDERDVYADRLAELLGTTTTTETDGSYTVTAGTLTLVSGSTAATLSVSGDDVQVDGTTLPHTSHTGEIGGLQRVIRDDVPAVSAELEDFVTQLADAFNAQNAAGFTESGAAGGPLLTYTVGQAAATFDVATTDIDDLALQGTATSGPHDATNAIALADLRTTPRTDGRTHDDALRQAVVGLGSRVSASERSAAGAAQIAITAEVNRTSAHGVSIDEEMVSLVQYQRALEANSRVMTAADEMLDTIVNRLGLVGR